MAAWPTAGVVTFPLTAAALYDALSYYFDHKAEIDQEIRRNDTDRFFASLRNDPDWVETRPGSFQRKSGFGSRA